MNLDPRFQSDDRANFSQADPLGFKIPAWFPLRGIAVLLVITAVLCAGFMLWWDADIARTLAQHRDEKWVSFFRTITVLGSSAIWYAATVFCFGLSLWIAKNSPQATVNWEWRRHARSILFVFSTMLVSGSLINALKILFGRHRPPEFLSNGVYGFDFLGLDVQSASFPSGHTQSITAVMVALGFLWPRGRVLFWCLAALVASSRVIITMHYAADIIAGAAVAIAVGWALKRYFERNGIPLAWNRP